MSIHIKLLGIFEKYQPLSDENGFWVLEEDHITIQQILSKTPIVSLNIGYNVLIEGIRVPKDYLLKSGDKVTVMPLIAGG